MLFYHPTVEKVLFYLFLYSRIPRIGTPPIPGFWIGENGQGRPWIHDHRIAVTTVLKGEHLRCCVLHRIYRRCLVLHRHEQPTNKAAASSLHRHRLQN